MRLSVAEIRAIRHIVTATVGAKAEVVLFGSRVNDFAKGGDVDLLITLDRTPPNVPLEAALLAARLERELEGRRVDVVIRTPDSPLQSIHRVALRTGIAL